MATPIPRPQRLVALFLLGCVLFSVALLRIFSHDGTVAGIPLLYAYLFGAWLALVVALALVVERTD